MDGIVTQQRPNEVCPSCGSLLVSGDRFCESCGARVEQEVADDRDHWELDLGCVAGVTDRGRVHIRNEDALFVSAHGSRAVAVVSDGVSSSSDPHRAAQLAADVAGRALVSALQNEQDAAPLAWDPARETLVAIAAAQQAVAELETSAPMAALPSACTLVTALWDGTQVTVGWIGDSRGYWIASGAARCLTVDDSWMQEQLAAGTMTERSARSDPRAHQITRWLGADGTPARAHLAAYVPTAPGRVVMCSDGMWNYAPAAEELAALAASVPDDAPATDVARALARRALAAGGHDNITVAVISATVGSADERGAR